MHIPPEIAEMVRYHLCGRGIFLAGKPLRRYRKYVRADSAADILMMRNVGNVSEGDISTLRLSIPKSLQSRRRLEMGRSVIVPNFY